MIIHPEPANPGYSPGWRRAAAPRASARQECSRLAAALARDPHRHLRLGVIHPGRHDDDHDATVGAVDGQFAALGRLEPVERAMGLMAGYGLQLWPILQDMSQLKDLYGERAGTFIANAGVQQVFGVNDFETAKWLSQMMGQETAGFQTDSFKPGDGPSFSNNLTGRDLLTPDEIMQLRPENQLLRVQGQATAVAQKLRYYADPEFSGLFTPDAR